MEVLPIALAVLVVLIFGVILWINRTTLYWARRHVPAESSSFYFIGRSEHVAHFLQKIYQRFRNTGLSFVGIFMIFQPAVLLIDLDLIKQVFISDFESFPDRGFYHNVRDDPLSGNIVRLEGEAWKRLRVKLTPTFSSGKMKFMFPTVVAVGERFTLLMEALMAKTNGELEVRDLCARYTTDVIGSVAFGIECNSLRDPSTEFRLMGDKAFGCFNPFLETIGSTFPRLLRMLRVKAFPQELIDFYTRIVSENIAFREKNGIRRKDFLDILIELKHSKVDGDFVLTLEEIIGQSFVFFIGGFETSSNTMTYCLYELSENPAIQERARRDVIDNLAKHNNELTYECLKGMRYLEQVFLETLRKYPVAPTLKRVTRKRFAVPNTEHVFESGVQVLIPVYAIHHDPSYYPDPAKFDPDRFSPDEIQKRHPMTYLPFGAGPRVCIAERFGKMQTMIGLAMLLRNFKISRTANTQKVLDFDKTERIIFKVIGGIELKVEKV